MYVSSAVTTVRLGEAEDASTAAGPAKHAFVACKCSHESVWEVGCPIVFGRPVIVIRSAWFMATFNRWSRWGHRK